MSKPFTRYVAVPSVKVPHQLGVISGCAENKRKMLCMEVNGKLRCRISTVGDAAACGKLPMKLPDLQWAQFWCA